MRVLILDNYDSFTYNLYVYVAAMIPESDGLVNDEVDMDDLRLYTHIILSPGPGLPAQSGKLMEVIDFAAGKIPVFGVCLGMQAIGLHYGGELYNQETVRHGVQMDCTRTMDSLLLQDVPETFAVGLYHSWALRNLPQELEVFCLSEEQVVMGIQHRSLPVYGVQFHPESVLTPHGKRIIKNFLFG
jgi:anthranilate synthase component 2